MVEEIFAEDHFTTVKVDGVRYVTGSLFKLVKISEGLELYSFPNDCQNLTITFESKMSTEQVQWHRPKGKEPVALSRNRCQLNDFALVDKMPLTQNMYHAKYSDRTVCALAVEVKVCRKANYYLLNVTVIVAAIISFAFCAWGIHPCAVGDRHGLDFNLILTAVAFKLVLSTMLPPVSYATRLDIYVYVGFLFLLAMTVSHTVLPYTRLTKLEMSALTRAPESYPEDEEQALINDDMMSFNIFLGLWVFWNVVYALGLWVGARSEFGKFLSEAQRNQVKYDKSDTEEIIMDE